MLYSKEIMKHFKNPRNVGKMKNFDALGKVGNLTCGDTMYLYLKIRKNKKREEFIKDIKFETFGCAVAIANTSLLTTMVKGKTLEKSLKITKDDLVKKFKNVPLVKVHCSLLAVDALGEAIYDYYKRQKRQISPELQKRHENAEAVGKEIEKRHGDLLKIEEEIHKENR